MIPADLHALADQVKRTDFLTAEYARSPSNEAPLRALFLTATLTATWVERAKLPWTAG